LPIADGGESNGRLITLIATIGIDNLNKRKGLARLLVQDQGHGVAILKIGRMDNNIQHKTERIDKDLVFDTFDFLARIIADRVGTAPPFEAERTL
jgi:hypothetical protein